MLPSGRGRREVYRPSVGRVRPDWSPNGRRLAFQLEGRLAWVRGDGTGLRLLPQLTEAEHDPAWSPDGRRLAFIGNRRCFGCSWLYTVRRDGTAMRRISREHASWPAWSVRGRIAFANDDDRMGDRIGVRDGLYSIEPDGSNLRRVFTRRWGGVQQPDWSPDGRTIAFHARDNIFTVGADGRDLKRLTGPKETRGQGSTDPAWSPDGRADCVHPRRRSLCHAGERGRGEACRRCAGTEARPHTPVGRAELTELAAPAALTGPVA